MCECVEKEIGTVFSFFFGSGIFAFPIMAYL